jgi:hypothetical protein
VARAIVSASGPKISCRGGGIGQLKGDSHLGIVKEDLEYYDDDDNDDEEAGYWSTLNARENGKTLYKPAFPSGTDEQLYESLNFYLISHDYALPSHIWIHALLIRFR